MSDIVLFHHVLGITPGMTELAERLRAAGHEVTVPDFFDGDTFDSIDQGFAAVQARGFTAFNDWADSVVDRLPAELVYVGVSLGVMAAQRLAQTRHGARAALFLESCAPAEEFGDWPPGLAAQIHGGERDPFFAGEGDIDAARALAAAQPTVELFTYPVEEHLFTDSSRPEHDSAALELVVSRASELLNRI